MSVAIWAQVGAPTLRFTAAAFCQGPRPRRESGICQHGPTTNLQPVPATRKVLGEALYCLRPCTPKPEPCQTEIRMHPCCRYGSANQARDTLRLRNPEPPCSPKSPNN
eukprot:2963118-Amphidinium_carterae.1